MDKITMKIKVGDRFFEEGNYPSAIERYQKAANDGSNEASYKLGNIYEKGFGVCIDLQRAYNYYINAGEKGKADAERVKNLIEGKNVHRTRRWEKDNQISEDDSKVFKIYDGSNLVGQLSSDFPEVKFLLTKPATDKMEFIPMKFSLKDLYDNHGILQTGGTTIKFETKQGNTIIDCILESKEIIQKSSEELTGNATESTPKHLPHNPFTSSKNRSHQIS